MDAVTSGEGEARAEKRSEYGALGTPGGGGQKDEEGPIKETEMEESVKQDEN